MSIEARIQELGLELPAAPKPAGSYVPAKISGNLVFTAGQLPLIDGQLMELGKLGADLDADRGRELAQRCALNALAAIKGVIGDLDRITSVVKVVGFVASTSDFTQQPQVINGASEFLQEVFGESGIHARSAVGVPVLPLNSPVEVELIVSFE